MGHGTVFNLPVTPADDLGAVLNEFIADVLPPHQGAIEGNSAPWAVPVIVIPQNPTRTNAGGDPAPPTEAEMYRIATPIEIPSNRAVSIVGTGAIGSVAIRNVIPAGTKGHDYPIVVR